MPRAFATRLKIPQGFGWSREDARFDWPTLVAAKDREITRLEGIYRSNLEKAGVQPFDERAEIVDAHTLRLSQFGRTVSADKILIATGGKPNIDEAPRGQRAYHHVE